MNLTEKLQAAAALLEIAKDGDPGWSNAYGGTQGVALAADLAAELGAELTRDALSLRTAAVAQMLEVDSVRGVEARTGLNRSTISRANRAWWPEATPFAHLTDKESW